MKTRVRVVFPSIEKEKPSWPYIGFDGEKRAAEVMNALAASLPDIEFSHAVYYSVEEAKQECQYHANGNFDGWLVYISCLWTRIPQFLADAAHACPYIIRSHAEDNKGASVQSLLSLGRTVTTIALSTPNRAMALHTARTVANVDDKRACRTKLAAEVDTDKILRNYHSDIFGWHQVTCYGDHRRAMKQLARLYGLRLIEQDR